MWCVKDCLRTVVPVREKSCLSRRPLLDDLPLSTRPEWEYGGKRRLMAIMMGMFYSRTVSWLCREKREWYLQCIPYPSTNQWRGAEHSESRKWRKHRIGKIGKARTESFSFNHFLDRTCSAFLLGMRRWKGRSSAHWQWRKSCCGWGWIAVGWIGSIPSLWVWCSLVRCVLVFLFFYSSSISTTDSFTRVVSLSFFNGYLDCISSLSGPVTSTCSPWIFISSSPSWDERVIVALEQTRRLFALRSVLFCCSSAPPNWVRALTLSVNASECGLRKWLRMDG